MIGICQRCKKEAYIYNPKQEIKLCSTCYTYLHQNREKVAISNKKWQKENNAYFRNYYAKHKERIKFNIEKRKGEKKKMTGENENENKNKQTIDNNMP